MGRGERERRPRSPSAVATGKRYPVVKSRPIRCAAEMYAVIAQKAQIAGQSQSASTTTASLEARSVLPNWKLEIEPSDAESFKMCDPMVKERS